MRFKTNDIKFIKYLILPLLIFLFFFNFYVYYVTKIPIRYWNEHDGIGKGYFFELFIKRDFNNPLWETTFSYDQPKLADYLYGLALYPYYLKQKETIKNKKYDFAMFLIDNNFYQASGSFYEQYKKQNKNFITWGSKPFEDFDVAPEYLIQKYGAGFLKTINIIFLARKVNVLILALSVVVTYFISLNLSNIPVSLLSSLLYGFNNLIVSVGLQAQAEHLFLLFFNIGILLLILIFSRNKKNWKIIIAFSIVSALLTQTKLNGVMILIFFNILAIFKALTVFLSEKNHQEIKFWFFSILIVNLISFLVFVSLHPFLYKSPIQRTLFMYKWRNNIAQKQAQKEVPWTSLPSYKSRLVAIYSNFFGREIKHFNNLIFLSKDNKVEPVHIQFFTLTFFILGLIYTFGQIIKAKHLFHSSSLIIILFILTQITMILYLKLNWDRYYIQLIFFFVFFESVGVYVFFQKIFSFILKSEFSKKN